MASIVARNGKYAVVYHEGDERHQIWKSGLSYAQAKRLKERKSIDEKKWRDQKKKDRQIAKSKSSVAYDNAGTITTDATVKQFMEEFIVTYGTKHWGDSYCTSSKSKMKNYVYPYFDKHRIVDVNSKIIDDYYAFLITDCLSVAARSRGKRNGVSAALVRDIHKVLRTAFNQAKRWKYIRENPFLEADIPNYHSKERPALSPREFEKILEYTDDKSHYDRYTIHVALCIQYYCTTRSGEIGGLQWPDYNPQEKTIHIYKTLNRVDKKNLNLLKLKIYYTFPILNPYNKTVTVLKLPRTEATERFGKLNTLMTDKLDCLKTLQKTMKETVFGDAYQDSQLIICQPNGRPIMPEQLNRKFKAIIGEMREAGYQFSSVPENLLDEVVFHSIRAVSATKKMQVSNGNIKAVMRAGGWAEPDMVIRYSKTFDDDQTKIVDQMESDYLNDGDMEPPLNTTELMRIIQSNPELVAQILATANKG